VLARRKTSNCSGKQADAENKMESTMFKETFTTLAIVAGLAATTAQAQETTGKDTRPTMEERFAKMDTNGDGQVTVDELQAQAEARFAAADTDGDGGLSAEEMREAGKHMHKGKHKGKKGDHKGGKEHRGDMKERLLERFDTDGDGALSAAELDEMGKGEHAKKGEHGKKREHKGEKGEHGKKGERGAKRFEKIDADGNGVVTLEELQAKRSPEAMIEKLDTDKSGGLSMEELAKGREHGKDKKKHD